MMGILACCDGSETLLYSHTKTGNGSQTLLKSINYGNLLGLRADRQPEGDSHSRKPPSRLIPYSSSECAASELAIHQVGTQTVR
jgi:hypothetical protein